MMEHKDRSTKRLSGKDSFNCIVVAGGLTNEMCDELITVGKEKLESAYVGAEKTLNASIRESKVAWLSDRKYIDHFFNMCDKVNETLNFHIKGVEHLQFTEYNAPTGHYGYHIDGNGIDSASYMSEDDNNNFNKDSVVRKLSMTALLNDDFVGGELYFNLGEEIPITIKKGDVVFFPSYYLHKVSPVTIGTRYSLVTWFVGPSFK